MSSLKTAYKKWITAIGLALIAVLFIRVFVISPFVIPSQSMENTLFPGDYILVSKWQHGARLPRYPLQWSKKGEETAFLDWIDLGYTRMPAISSIERNELIAFNYPIDKRAGIDHKTTMLKRAIGMPGDTISVYKGQVYVNNKIFTNSPHTKHYYVLITNNKSSKVLFPEHSNPERIAQNSWKLELTKKAAEALSKHDEVITLEQIVENPKHYNPDVYPSDEALAWNAHYIDQLIVPKKGQQIELNARNFNIYQTIIYNYEHQHIQLKNNRIYINQQETKSYTFQSDYYWMLGDNRDNSLDSRFWGVIPENHIIGKVNAVLFSWDKNNNNGPRWERSFCFFKKDGSLVSFRGFIYSLIAIFVLIKIIVHYVKR